MLQKVITVIYHNSVIFLIHWDRVTHICVSKLSSIGSDNGLSPGRRQAIVWTNAGILFIGPLETNFSEILIKIHIFSFRKMHLKMSSGKRRPFCLGLRRYLQHIHHIGIKSSYVPMKVNMWGSFKELHTAFVSSSSWIITWQGTKWYGSLCARQWKPSSLAQDVYTINISFNQIRRHSTYNVYWLCSCQSNLATETGLKYKGIICEICPYLYMLALIVTC